MYTFQKLRQKDAKWPQTLCVAAINFKKAHGMDGEVDPSLRAAVHRRVREEHEFPTPHTREAIALLALVGWAGRR